MDFQVPPPPDVIDPNSFAFDEIVPGVPVWVPLVAQLIPWIVGLVVDPDAENRQRVLVSALLSGVIATVTAVTGEGGATMGEAVTVFLAALLSSQVGYGVAKGLTNGKINELSNRKPPPYYQPPYAWPDQRPRLDDPMDVWSSSRRPNRSHPEHRRFHPPTEEIPRVPHYQSEPTRWYSEPETQAATTFNYDPPPRPRPDAPDTSHAEGRRYI